MRDLLLKLTKRIPRQLPRGVPFEGATLPVSRSEPLLGLETGLDSEKKMFQGKRFVVSLESWFRIVENATFIE